MEKVAAGKIRKLQWGIVPGLPTQIHVVGSRVAGKEDYEISDIVEDTNTVFSLGRYEYLVYIKKSKVEGAPSFLWKRYNLPPDSIEYFREDNEEAFV